MKTKKQIKKPSKQVLAGGLLAMLIAAGATKGFALDPVWADVVGSDTTLNPPEFYLDRNGDGLEDLILHTRESSVGRMVKRYIQEGGRVLYNQDGLSGPAMYNDRIIRIIMPSGRVIKITDIYTPPAGVYSAAHEYEAQQAALEAAAQAQR